MKRQKKYHDSKLAWESFKAGDKVLVYFPQRITGKSPKLMCFWQGPFDVVSQKSTVTYEVKRPSDEKTQIVHVDRLRKYRMQQLVGEDSNSTNQSGNESQMQPLASEMLGEESARNGSVEIEEVDDSGKEPYVVDSNVGIRASRKKKMPTRFADYVLI